MHYFRRLRIRRQTRRQLNTAVREQKSIVLVYQPGKVASSTVTHTLCQCPELSVFQLHALIPDVIDGFIDRQLKLGMKPTKCLIRGQVIWEELIAKKRAPFRVITLVREPIERNVSAYFQRFPEFFPGKTPDEIPDQVLDDTFLECFDHRNIVEWNDEELYRALGVDLYTSPFNKENGYGVVQHPQCDVLVLRTTLEDVRKISAISLFLGMEKIPELIVANEASQKDYKEIYRRFVKRIKLSESLCSDLLDSRYARHFFTQQERELAFMRWSRPAAPIAMRRAA